MTGCLTGCVPIDTHLARGASNGGFTFHDRGGHYGRTKGAKRVVAVDFTGLPVAALVVPASTHENRASELMLEHLSRQGVTNRLELVLVDRSVTAAAARTLGRHHDLEVRRVVWDNKQPVFRPSGMPGVLTGFTPASPDTPSRIRTGLQRRWPRGGQLAAESNGWRELSPSAWPPPLGVPEGRRGRSGTPRPARTWSRELA
jgi:hypothetical protein